MLRAKSYLLFYECALECVEELERVDDVALYENSHYDGGCRPETGADWHLPEPGLEREASLSTEAALPLPDHLVHLDLLGVPRGLFSMQDVAKIALGDRLGVSM